MSDEYNFKELVMLIIMFINKAQNVLCFVSDYYCNKIF